MNQILLFGLACTFVGVITGIIGALILCYCEYRQRVHGGWRWSSAGLLLHAALNCLMMLVCTQVLCPHFHVEGDLTFAAYFIGVTVALFAMKGYLLSERHSI